MSEPADIGEDPCVAPGAEAGSRYSVPMLDVDFLRAQFPALDTPWALFDNAGGSVPARQVVERVTDYMSRLQVQHGASYELSREAGEALESGRRAAERLLGAEPGEVAFGPSSTVLVHLLAQALRPLWSEGDELIVTSLDHETNVGPWRALEASGIRVREWDFDPETQRLELEGLEPLLNQRTRLVAFTHCSNVVGSIHDVAAIAERVRAAGALSCVDGVAYAPHRCVDVKALGADFYFASLYKLYGPHMGALYGRSELLRAARGQSHFFVGEEAVPAKFEPGNVPHELGAGVAGVGELFDAIDQHHFEEPSNDRGRLARVFELLTEQEVALVTPLLAFLGERPNVRVLGEPSADSSKRAPTVAFTVDGRDAAELPPLLDEHQLAVRFGHFYAYRAIERMGLMEQNGVVRVSLLPYNTRAEVERLIEALDEVL